jgi:uncharacterized protein (UPF0128 family)
MERFKYNKNTTKNSENSMNLDGYQIRPSKHFVLTWMRKWDYDINSLKKALESSYKTSKVGKCKYESYFREKGKSRKLIYIKEDKQIFIITGAEGK